MTSQPAYTAIDSLTNLVATDAWARDRLGHDSAMAGEYDTEVAVRCNYAYFLTCPEPDRERAAQATLLCLWSMAARGTTFFSPHPASPYEAACVVYRPLTVLASAEAAAYAQQRRAVARAALNAAHCAACKGTPVPADEYERLYAEACASEGAYQEYLDSDKGAAPAARAALAEMTRLCAELTGGPGEFGRLFAAVGVLRAMPLDPAAW